MCRAKKEKRKKEFGLTEAKKLDALIQFMKPGSVEELEELLNRKGFNKHQIIPIEYAGQKQGVKIKVAGFKLPLEHGHFYCIYK